MRTTARILLPALLLASGASAPGAAEIFVVTSDPNGQSSAVIDLLPPWPAMQDVEPVGGSPVVRHFYGKHYVVNRLDGTIQVVDEATLETDLVFSVGSGSEPHDILVVAPGRAYVSRHADSFLWEVNPATGALLDMIDLGSLADRDGNPEMSMLALDGNHLFVQLQRTDTGLTAVPPSYLAVVDVRTNQLVDADPATPGTQAIALAGTIPSFKMHVDAAARRLFVSTPAQRLDVTGGIEEIDLDTLRSLGFIYPESRPSVDLGGFVMLDTDRGYVIGHTDIVASSHLMYFERDPGAPGQGEIYFSLFNITDTLAYDTATGQIFYPDPAATPPGIHVFDAATRTRLTSVPIATGKPPVDLAVARFAAPGEATGLEVTGYDAATGSLSILFQPACGATNHNIVFGPLEQIGTYGYSGEICGIGASGAYAGFDPGPGSYFFLVAGTDGGGHDGSYGLDGNGVERPEDLLDLACTFTREIGAACP